MKQYPSIPKQHRNGAHVYYVFDKLDGSNIRAEWSPKSGLYKFGTRTRLLGTDQGIISTAKDMILAHQDKIHASLKKMQAESATLFFEFYGANSFAGTHVDDEHHEIAFLDLHIYKKGILAPKEYLAFAEEAGLTTPKVLHVGFVNPHLANEVVEGTLAGMTFEGVVCKGPFVRKLGHPDWYKIKNKHWLEKLKTHCGNNEKLFEQLA